MTNMGTQQAAKTAVRVERRINNLVALLELGEMAPRSKMSISDIAKYVIGDIRAEAKSTRILSKDLVGRRGYHTAKKLTAAVRGRYDALYSALLEPVRDVPVPNV